MRGARPSGYADAAMRRGLMLASTLCVLALAACGGGGKTSTSSTGSSASATSTTATSTARRGVTTVARAPTKRGGTAPAERHGPIPAVPIPTAACHNLPQPAAGPAGALRLRDGLQPSIDSLSAFVAHRAAGSLARSEQLRAASVLRALRGAQSAAARYVASPTSANQKALSTAVQLEGSTAHAETLSVCTIPGA